MKPIYLISFLAIALSSQAQTENQKTGSYPDPPRRDMAYDENGYNAEKNIYSTTGLQVQPEFPGGQKAFSEFIMSNFYAPPIADGPKTVKAYVSFVVEKDGTVTSIKVLKDPGYGVGEEAIRVLKLSPKWKPGVQNGKAVRVMYNLPLTLNLKRAATSKSGFRN